MADTIRIGDTRDGKAFLADNRRSYFTTERKDFRKATVRRNRRIVKTMLGAGTDADDLACPRHPATGGWESH